MGIVRFDRVLGTRNDPAPAIVGSTGSGSPFHWLNPISGWGPMGNLGYYVHRGRVYWQGGVGASDPRLDYPSIFLRLPALIAPVEPVAFTAYGDWTNMDDVQPPSVEMVVNPDGTMAFTDAVPRFPGDTFVAYLFDHLTWELSSATTDDPGAAWTDAGPYIPNSGSEFDAFQIDAEIAEHGNRLHLRGSIGMPDAPATSPDQTLINTAGAPSTHPEWTPDGASNPDFPQQIGSGLVTMHVPFTGGILPIEGYVFEVVGGGLTFITQSWGVRSSIHLSIPAEGLLRTVNSSWRTLPYDAAVVGGFYQTAEGGYDIENPTQIDVRGNYLMPVALGDYGLDPSDPAEQSGLFIGLVGDEVDPYFYKATYTKQDHFHWFTLWAFDFSAPDGVGDGLRWRNVYETEHVDLAADPGPQTTVVGGVDYYVIRGNLSLARSEDIPGPQDDQIAFALGPTGFTGGFPGWGIDDGGADGTSNPTLTQLRIALASAWSAGRVEDSGGAYWFGDWRASVGGGTVPSVFNPYGPGRAFDLTGKGWFLGGAREAGSIAAGDPLSGVVRADQ